MPKKIMISNGLRGKDNPEQYVTDCRLIVDAYYEASGEDYERLNTFFADYNGNALEFFGRGISEGLALADEIVFMDDWEKYRGCLCEHFIAVQYGIPCVYLSTGITTK